MNARIKIETLPLLSSSETETFIGGKSLCVTNAKVNGVIGGFCATAGWFNVFVGGGCVIYASVQYFACD